MAVIGSEDERAMAGLGGSYLGEEESAGGRSLKDLFEASRSSDEFLARLTAKETRRFEERRKKSELIAKVSVKDEHLNFLHTNLHISKEQALNLLKQNQAHLANSLKQAVLQNTLTY